MSNDATNDDQAETKNVLIEPFFEFELPSMGKTTFDSQKDVEAFILRVESSHSWLLSIISKDAAQTIRHSLSNLKEGIKVDDSREVNLKTLHSAFQTAFCGKQHIFHPDSPQLMYIKLLGKKFGNKIVADVAGWLMGNWQSSSKDGIALGVLYDAFGKSLNILQEEWQTKLNNVHETHEENERARAELFAGILENNKTERNTQQKHFDDLEGKYKAIQSAKVPTAYWKTKQTRHKRLAIGFGIASVIVGVIGVIIITCISVSSRSDVSHIYDVWHLLSFSFPTLVMAIAVYWTVRILVKLCLTNIHLGADANERVVMTKTFIAMLVDEDTTSTITTHGVHIILEPLFRHAPIGLVAYDGSPQSLFDKIMKMKYNHT